MPIYEFECLQCGHVFDRLQKIADPNPSHCPDCAVEGEVQRRVTAPSFRLAGGGWYETDFKKDGDKKRNLVDKGESSKGESSKAESAKTDSAKTESAAKPAATSASQPKSEAKPAAS